MTDTVHGTTNEDFGGDTEMQRIVEEELKVLGRVTRTLTQDRPQARGTLIDYDAELLASLPALKRPTISQLSEPGWVAVETIIDGGELPAESFGLKYGKITWEYKQHKHDGSATSTGIARPASTIPCSIGWISGGRNCQVRAITSSTSPITAE